MMPRASFLFVALQASVFATVFAMALVLASTPTPLPSSLGIRGLKRARSVRSRIWADFEPLVRWTGARLAPFLTSRARARLDAQISFAGDPAGITPEEYVALCMLSGIGALCLGSTLCSLFDLPAVCAVVGGVLGAALPWQYFSGAAQRREQSVQQSLPYVVDLLALALGAGIDFPGALRQVSEKASDPDDPMMGEVSYILQELLVGKTRRQAMLEFAVRCPYEAVQEFVSAVVKAEQRGNPLAEVLQIQASSSRTRRTVHAEESAAKAGVQLIVPCALVFISVLLIIVAPLFMQLEPALGV